MVRHARPIDARPRVARGRRGQLARSVSRLLHVLVSGRVVVERESYRASRAHTISCADELRADGHMRLHVCHGSSTLLEPSHAPAPSCGRVRAVHRVAPTHRDWSVPTDPNVWYVLDRLERPLLPSFSFSKFVICRLLRA